MSEERRPVLRGFSHPDHETGRTLHLDPAGTADGPGTAEQPRSVWVGPIPSDCRWWVEDVPDFSFTDGEGRIRTRHLGVGGDGNGPLVGEPLIEEPPAKTTTVKKPAGSDTEGN